MIPFILSILVSISIQAFMLKVFADSAANKTGADPFLDRTWTRAGKVSAALWATCGLLSFVPFVGWALSLAAWVGIVMDRYKFGFGRTLAMGIFQVGLIGITRLLLWFFNITLF